jgi:NAD(P)H-hydrate epimerase
MALIDRQAQESFGIPEIVLMEDAALGIFSLIRDRIWKGRLPGGQVVFLAGKGNNGGDALAVARHCHFAGMRNLCVILGAGEPKAGSPAGIHLGILRALGIDVVDFSAQGKSSGVRATPRLLLGAEYLVDGLLGTGLSGEVRPPLTALIDSCNESAAFRIAVDIPSGIGDAFRQGYTAFRADCTLTVGLPKLSLYLPHARRFCGDIRVVPGVFPTELIEQEDIPGTIIEDSLKPSLLPPLQPDTHKGKRGHLAVFAGSEGTTGAAWLCSTAAARSRAGLVTLFIDRELYGHSMAKYSSVMLRPWDGDLPEMDGFDTLLVGPGWGLTEQRERILSELFATDLAGVLDADGITLLSRMGGKDGKDTPKLDGRWILTPHPGEFARFLGKQTAEVLADPLTLLLQAAARVEAVIVLKGHCTFVASPDGRYGVFDGMNPALATGGSGDVLAGICAGLLTSGCDPQDAAVLGVLVHGQIGGTLSRERGCFLAEDMVAAVSSAFL